MFSAKASKEEHCWFLKDCPLYLGSDFESCYYNVIQSMGSFYFLLYNFKSHLCPQEGRTPLHIAALKDDLVAARILLSLNCNPRIKD